MTPEACMALVFDHRRACFFLARSVLHLKRWALLWPTLPAIIEPRRGDVSMPQPLLHLGDVYGIKCLQLV
jgi:hypothetical protein